MRRFSPMVGETLGIHGANEVYEWLVESAAWHQPDAIVLAGDLFSAGWEEEQRAEAQTIIILLLKRISVPVFYIMGNDDTSQSRWTRRSTLFSLWRKIILLLDPQLPSNSGDT
jgi:DNA repair exonuclease SbcCD nuclease subunit